MYACIIGGDVTGDGIPDASGGSPYGGSLAHVFAIDDCFWID